MIPKEYKKIQKNTKRIQKILKKYKRIPKVWKESKRFQKNPKNPNDSKRIQKTQGKLQRHLFRANYSQKAIVSCKWRRIKELEALALLEHIKTFDKINNKSNLHRV